jgi:hypothetical protein
MKKNKQNLFSEEIQKNLGLSDESVKAIQESLENKIDLAVEAALQEQDDVYAEKLTTLMTTLDKDRTAKMKKLMEAFDRDKTAKLTKVIKKYEREQQGDLVKFKKQLTESISEYLDAFLVESFPKKDLETAVKNKTAFKVLENLRNVFSIDYALMDKSLSGAIIEGKTEIDQLRKENVDLKNNLNLLTEEKNKTQVKLFLEGKTSKFPESKKNFIQKALSDKSLKFIKENFDYTVRLFENQEKKQLEIIKEQALQSRKHKPDFVKTQKIITEKVNTKVEENDPYLSALESMTFRK